METILILDFGSQYTQLIARRVREQKVFCEIYPGNLPVKSFPKNSKGIILSGGPSSVFDPGAPLVSAEIFDLKVPVLGICYGLQLMAHLLEGKVVKSQNREYGKAILQIQKDSELFQDCPKSFQVWMSHGDSVVSPPPGFVPLAKTESLKFAAIENKERNIYGVQFHPEVAHTENGQQILQNFLFRICKCKGDWTTESFISSSVSRIKEEVDNQKIICAVSGGVDSTVCAALVNQAVGKNLYGIFVDNGLLRKNEAMEVLETFKKVNLNIRLVDAKDKFLKALSGVIDPEEKRKIIGRVFIEVFEEEANKIGDIKFLAQGTLYPDLIESRSFKGPSATIKSHHNVGGLPEIMNLKLVEPLKELFKDEVRELGKKLGVPEKLLKRHPFPGPGLAVRVIGEITEDKLILLREADAIFMEELQNSGSYDQVWQAFSVLLPVQTVGVMGDERTYENVVALRAVTSLDGMTADWAKLPYELLQKISNRIINEVKGINRVVYDVSSKPPATIEWE